MKAIFYIKLSILAVIIPFIISSCDKFDNESPTINEEGIKDLQGSWKIVKAYRNGVEITNLMDFSKFRLKMNADNTYSIENYLPFLVRDEGTWELNDPYHPFLLSFKENIASEAHVSNLNYPAVEGVRQLKLTFVPGCQANSYTYEFEKASN
ncbi:MAG: DUF5004 domain-containing protein [Dysgonomonas sp.]|nr:DUF5004 domain-containing protein [Dysgonomonas sp.]